MNRYAKNRDLPHLPPVEKVELSAKPSKGRLAAVLLLLAVGAAALSYAFYTFITGDKGWREIEVISNAGAVNAEEFVLLYDVGASGVSAATENRALTALYSQTLAEVYQAFCNEESFEGLNNVRSLNDHPNETLTVPSVLYDAFALLQEYGDRAIYLAPIYTIYDDMFFSGDDSVAAYYDPDRNPEIAAWYAEVAAFARDPRAVEVQLLGDDRVCLYVSDEYLRYAEENELTNFVDFFWMKNAFLVDYLAGVLRDSGFTRGSISSFDGFVCNLDDSGTEYGFNLWGKNGADIEQAAVLQYTGARSIVYLRDYILEPLDVQHYYRFGDGSTRTAYLDVEDLRCKAAVDSLVGYSATQSCAEIMLRLKPIYIADALQPQKLSALAENGIYAIYCDGKTIFHTETDADLRTANAADAYTVEKLA